MEIERKEGLKFGWETEGEVRGVREDFDWIFGRIIIIAIIRQFV